MAASSSQAQSAVLNCSFLPPTPNYPTTLPLFLFGGDLNSEKNSPPAEGRSLVICNDGYRLKLGDRCDLTRPRTEDITAWLPECAFDVWSELWKDWGAVAEIPRIDKPLAQGEPGAFKIELESVVTGLMEKRAPEKEALRTENQ